VNCIGFRKNKCKTFSHKYFLNLMCGKQTTCAPCSRGGAAAPDTRASGREYIQKGGHSTSKWNLSNRSASRVTDVFAGVCTRCVFAVFNVRRKIIMYETFFFAGNNYICI